jgi:hypothetical protein
MVYAQMKADECIAWGNKHKFLLLAAFGNRRHSQPVDVRVGNHAAGDEAPRLSSCLLGTSKSKRVVVPSKQVCLSLLRAASASIAWK